MQKLDDASIEAINVLVARGIPIVIVDSVSKTARELLSVKEYVQATFPEAKTFTAVMNYVTYQRAPHAPWRSIALHPDFYGSLIESVVSPYIEYPWEYSSLEAFNEQSSRS